MHELAQLDFCYLTTTGRVSGRHHTIEIWFALEGSTIFLLAGNHTSDWVKNLKQQPAVRLRLGDHEYTAQARVVHEPAEDALARRLVVGKYQPKSSDDLSEWGRTALVVALDVS
ncbi:MAG TPA: nitroreductase family deazaflavin-dependent oxidoreductase [Roseiflexaceae bacterium]|nr:nitroreductase family deazaflavin-dependent oxidoreductase [Roseiflexaceae bacterium]HMP40315.1 nitroreductase family deazaflavin-dependent oxidoreductase [Roseiflexaceae bacterium]